MRKTSQFLNDEHMRMYEWSGAGPGIALSLPAKSKRTHPWHASYAVLAVLTTLLILNGCDNKASTEMTKSRVDQATRDAKEGSGPLYDELGSHPVPPESAAPAANGAPEPAVEKSELPGEDPQFRDRPLPA